jgi:hypothetical protein
MTREMLAPWLWNQFTVITLGIWLITGPYALGYRSERMAWNDSLCGTLVLFFCLLSISPERAWARWANGLTGVWLLMAPLVFRAPTPGAYANDTLTGCLVIAFSVRDPGHPGERPLPGPEIPPGWSYNPSTWIQRVPIIALAFFGSILSGYMAAFQLGHLGAVWDPVFGPGTEKVLESDVSRAFPVSDAGLGAVSYLLEALSGFIGGTARWRTMPWMVVLFGIMVVPLGVVSIVLITLQPLVVGEWCFLCLVTAAAMLVMISPAMDEVIATGQFLLRSRREGKPFWGTFRGDGALEDTTEERRGREAGSLYSRLVSAIGIPSVPWNLAASTVIGVWLMMSPALFGTTGAAADSEHLVGALVVTCAVIAMGEVARSVRWVNLLLGAWTVAAPWLLAGDAPAAEWNALVSGVLLVLLSARRGPVKEHYGGWDRFIF